MQRLRRFQSTAIVAFSLLCVAGTSAAVRASGGSPNAFNHLGYLAIVLMAHRFGTPGGVGMAVLAALVLGPFASIPQLNGPVEDATAWSARAAAFLGIGGITGWLFDRLRRQTQAAREHDLQIVQRETELRDATEQLQFQASLLNEVQAAVIATDLDNRITYWNPAAENLYGWSREEATGRELHELIADDPAKAVAIPNSVIATGRRWIGVTRDRRKDRSVVIAHLSAVPLRSADGSVVGGLGTVLDIGEQERAIEAMQAAEGRLAGVLEAASEALIMIEADGTVAAWNRKAERDFGWRPAEAMGRAVTELIAPIDIVERIRGISSTLPRGARSELPEDAGVRVRNRGGDWLPARLAATAIGSKERETYLLSVNLASTSGPAA